MVWAPAQSHHLLLCPPSGRRLAALRLPLVLILARNVLCESGALMSVRLILFPSMLRGLMVLGSITSVNTLIC